MIAATLGSRGFFQKHVPKGITMKRFLVLSCLTVLLSAGFAGNAKAQQPYDWSYYYYPNHAYNNQSYNAGGMNSYYSPQTNNWANQYFTYPGNTNSFPNVATSNQWSRQALRSGNSNYNTSPNSPPTLYRPYYTINGSQSRIVPYASPNYYAAPSYRYIQMP